MSVNYPNFEISLFILDMSRRPAVSVPITNNCAADVFAASQGKTYDGESRRRVGHPGAFLGKARPLSGEGPQPREHTTTCSRQQARQLPAHSRQVPQLTVGANLASVVSLRARSA